MVEDGRVGSADVGLEAAVEHADLAPVQVQRLDISITDTSSKTSLLKSRGDGAHGWLRGKAGHALGHTSMSHRVQRGRAGLLSMATSTTSAPAAAQAIMDAAEIPAVSCEWT